MAKASDAIVCGKGYTGDQTGGGNEADDWSGKKSVDKSHG